jgi:aminoglycoside phosphotransferase (APT) family kinase protein
MSRFVSKEIINKGWSGDKKYCVTDKDGNRFLLRVSPIEQYDRKKTEFELMGKVAALGVPMCKPLEFGTSDEGVYSIQTFIDGVDAEETAPTLTSDKQYHYGFEAGKILKEIHKLPAPENVPDWEIRFNQKIDRKIKMYSECPFKYENGQAFLDYISTHRHLLANRPQTYQHGDYHIGNMMIGNDGNLYIIDFNRNDYGDPWEEFNRIVWCAQTAPLFATGMVNGYFGNNVPKEFWELLALYISSNTLSSLPWAIPFGEEQMQVMINQANDVLNWYDNMKNPIPTWYKGDDIT